MNSRGTAFGYKLGDSCHDWTDEVVASDARIPAVVKYVFGYSCGIRPLTNRLFLTINLGKYVVSAVITLLFCTCPSAILWSVSFIVADSVDGEVVLVTMCYGPISKCCKIALPFVTDGYSTASIVLVASTVWIIASGSHRIPNIRPLAKLS